MKSVALRIGIVGAGPVGMYLALRLHREGFFVRVYDGRTHVRLHSRSIGVHPPAWKLMEAAGLTDALMENSCRVELGDAFWNGRRLGSISLLGLDGQPLTIPQNRTEEVLQAALLAEAPGVLHLGSEVAAVSTGEIRLTDSPVPESFDLVVGCDGRGSVVRGAMQARWTGESYDIPYLMGDFPDTTGMTGQAAILLGRQGLVESFPLPGGMRRWVVRLRAATQDASDDERVRHLADTIASRTPFSVNPASCTMVSAFGVERYEAGPMARDGLFLAGDAAHVVSPIGGQGMNLGWFDAEWLVRELVSSTKLANLARRYDRARRRAFRVAARRAEFNMWMGAPCSSGGAATRFVLTRLALMPLFRNGFLERFTMKGLLD